MKSLFDRYAVLLSKRDALSTEQSCAMQGPRRSGSPVPWVGWPSAATHAAENRTLGEGAQRTEIVPAGTAPAKA